MSHTKSSNVIKQVTLTSLEKEVIIGCLLGDGSLDCAGKEYRLRVEHKADHKEYVLWKYAFLKRLCLTAPQYVSTHDSYRFGTVGHAEITRLRKSFYVNGIKIIPDDLSITPLMLAILFMDDGCKIHSTASLALHAYSLKEINHILVELNKYNVRGSVQKDGHGEAKRLYIKTASYETFKKLVESYVKDVSCMTCKLV
ncbi:MAG: hypothetical protein HYY43_00870 [Deltaproteobacteria bacterium]|nr:hypothetical protein [Deltaproteobacteria bacterium]MBI2974136.1 hypothetical protein [Deltaproteobacteria bacterium]